MRIEAVHLQHVRIPLKRSFKHALHERAHADAALVTVLGDLGFEIRKVDGESVNGGTVPEGLLEMLRVAGFVDGYRGEIAIEITGKTFVRPCRPRPIVARMLCQVTLRIAPGTPDRAPS